MTRFHFLQHVPFEDPANIGAWARSQGMEVTVTHLYASEPLPQVHEIDWLAVMGGPMNIYQYDQYPWLIKEKTWIRQAIDAGKVVIGVCLGAQLIADILGAPVTRSPQTEIGWFPVTLTDEAMRDSLLSGLPARFEAFHWHGDTFAIPPGASHLAYSQACANQAFQYGERVLGLQFHLDYTLTSLEAMVKHCGNELATGSSIQSMPATFLDAQRVQNISSLLFTVLEQIGTAENHRP